MPIKFVIIGMLVFFGAVVVGIYRLREGKKELGTWFLIEGVPGLVIFSLCLVGQEFISRDRLCLLAVAITSSATLIAGAYAKRNEDKINPRYFKLARDGMICAWGGLFGFLFWIAIHGWPK